MARAESAPLSGGPPAGDAPAVVIVTFESAAVIGPCLERLLASRPLPEVVVVDNASRDDSAEVAARHPVTLIRNADNRGFAAAVVQGVAATRGDPLVLLNPDTEIEPDCLEHLAAALADPQVAIAGCKILDTDGVTIQHAGGVVAANALTDHIGRGEIDRGQHDVRRDVPYVTGAGLALRRATWARLGGLDGGYWPAYFEELELCWRARAAGYRVVVEPRAVMRHHEALSSRGGAVDAAAGTRDSDAGGAELASVAAPLPALYYGAYHRNRIRFVLRNYPLSQFLTGFLPAELRWMARGHHRGQGGALARAWLAALRESPATLRHRLQTRRTRSPGDPMRGPR